jgi:cell division protein FtsB
MLNLSSRPLTVALGLLLLLLQYEIWSTNGGLSQVWHLKQSIKTMENKNTELQEKNMVLAADVDDLRNGSESVEEHARMDLGMVKKNEIFYQIID